MYAYNSARSTYSITYFVDSSSNQFHLFHAFGVIGFGLSLIILAAIIIISFLSSIMHKKITALNLKLTELQRDINNMKKTIDEMKSASKPHNKQCKSDEYEECVTTEDYNHCNAVSGGKKAKIYQNTEMKNERQLSSGNKKHSSNTTNNIKPSGDSNAYEEVNMN